MANIYDYLQWRGDLSYDDRPFNDVDNLICSTLSYLSFQGILGEGGADRMSVREACDRLLARAANNSEQTISSLSRVDAIFPRLLAESRRFGNAVLHDYVEAHDRERMLQFSALTIDLTPHESYVAFRGTDATLVGWREDFMISFSVTAAQVEAAAYLQSVMPNLLIEGRHIYVGGHSKGGNLAMCAALSLPAGDRDELAGVWSNDGPGMAPEVNLESASKVFGDRYVRIVPGYSIVGMLFERPEERKTVCQSSAAGPLQHDPISWQVGVDGMETLEELIPESALIDERIAGWLAELSLEQRAAFTNEIFDALEAGGATRLRDIADSPSNLAKVLRAMGDLDEDVRDAVYRLVASLGNATVDSMKSAPSGTSESRQSLLESAMKALRIGGRDRTS